MIILYLEVLIGICLIIVEIIMCHKIKKNNDAWWRTYWAKDKIMMDKILEIDKKTNALVSNKDLELKEYCEKNNIKSLADF